MSEHSYINLFCRPCYLQGFIFFICCAASVHLTGSQDTCYTLLITEQYNLSKAVVSHLLCALAMLLAI